MNRSFRTIAAAVTLGLSLAVPAAAAQVDVTVTEINPTQSTLDPTDPDGATGGRVNGIGVASDGQTMYAASEWGGLFKSTDAGQNWFPLEAHLPVACWDVEVDPRDPDRVIATSFYDGRVNSLAGINVSTDGGETWIHPATATAPDGSYTSAVRRSEPSAYGIAFDPDDPDSVYVGTNTGLAVSRDAGVTWEWIDPTPGTIADEVWDVVVHDDGIVDLVGADGHQRSADGGTTWTTATGLGLPSGVGSIAVSPDEPYVLFAVVGTTLFESDDGGQSWPFTMTNPSPQGRIPFVETNQRTGATFDLWFGDVGLHRVACTTPGPAAPGGARRAPQNGWSASFTRQAGGHDDCAAIAFQPGVATDACPILFSCDGGVYVNTIASSPACHSPAWEQPAATPRGLWLFGMDGAHRNGLSNEDLYMGAQDNGLFATTDAGSSSPTWSNLGCCDGFDFVADATRAVFTQCCWSPPPANRLFVGPAGLASFNPIPPAQHPPGNLPGFTAIDVVDQYGAGAYVAVTTQGVFQTPNIAANPIQWNPLGGNAWPGNAFTRKGVKAAVDGGIPTFYLQVGNGDARSADQLWRFDGLAQTGTWTQVQPPGGTGGFNIFDVDPGDPERLFACHLQPGADPAMLLSEDGGTTWTPLPGLDVAMTGAGAFRYTNSRGPTDFTGFGGYPQPTLVAMDPGDPDTLVAGAADAGVFLSLDRGETWRVMTDSLNPPCVHPDRPRVPRPRFAYFDPEGPLSILGGRSFDVYVGTQGRGAWRFRIAVPVNPRGICQLFPQLCREPELERGLIVLDCLDAPGCIVLDDLPRNCLVKFDCPGCGPNELCPPWHHLYLDELEWDVWQVGLFTRDGDPAAYEIYKVATGIVVSFRPEKELFREGEIGDYFLAFQLRPDAKPARYRVGARLEVSERPFDPKLGEPIEAGASR